MRKLIFLFAVLFFTANAKYSFSQISETSMKDIIETFSDKIKTLEDVKDMEIVNTTIDLLVNTTGEKYVYRYLDNSFYYNVIAFGDRRIKKINIDVRKKSAEKWIKVDNVSGENAELELFPDTRAFYEFTISVVEFNGENNAGHFALLIYHKDPLKNK